MLANADATIPRSVVLSACSTKKWWQSPATRPHQRPGAASARFASANRRSEAGGLRQGKPSVPLGADASATGGRVVNGIAVWHAQHAAQPATEARRSSNAQRCNGTCSTKKGRLLPSLLRGA